MHGVQQSGALGVRSILAQGAQPSQKLYLRDVERVDVRVAEFYGAGEDGRLLQQFSLSRYFEHGVDTSPVFLLYLVQYRFSAGGERRIAPGGRHIRSAQAKLRVV